MNRTLPELIEQLTTRAACPSDITDALTEIDRRLTALEERTAPPLSGNEVTANLLRAAEDARAKAVEDGLAMLEGRVQGAESEPTERDVGYGVVSAVGWPDDRAKLRARVDAASAEFMAHVGQGPPPTARIDALRAALSGMVADESAGKTVLRMLAAEALAADDKAVRAMPEQWAESDVIRRAVAAEREACAVEAERALIEYAEIDVLDKTPERSRIARRIRARGGSST